MLKKTLVHILTSEQQQQAVERIKTLISSGISSGEAIIKVARELRAHNIGEKIFISSHHDEEDSDARC